jgi:phosphoribosyl-AMP cyclohydrolase
MDMEKIKFIDQLKFDDRGLIPCIAQDVENGQVLMMAYMNQESVKKTIETGIATYYSRSRKKLWVKGESSGHTQEIKELWFDCDSDCLLIKVKQNVAACHVGYRSCFFNRVRDGVVEEIGEKLFSEEKVYGSGS